MSETAHPVYVGTAGWSVPKAVSPLFSVEGSILVRYASRLRAVEINSSFYRSHRAATYERWAAATPADFRFAVKAPRQVTHERRLIETAPLLAAFADEIAHLGGKLGPVLFQLPPSLAFDDRVAGGFFRAWRDLFPGLTVCEPRHRSWFSHAAARRFVDAGIARVIADPLVCPQAAEGLGPCAYYRLHGSPVMYESAYGADRLDGLALRLAASAAIGSAWCVFDNTRFGAATTDALALSERLAAGDCATGAMA